LCFLLEKSSCLQATCLAHSLIQTQKKKKKVKIEGEKTAVKIIADSNVKLKYGILAWMIYIKIIQFFLQFWLGMLRII